LFQFVAAGGLKLINVIHGGDAAAMIGDMTSFGERERGVDTAGFRTRDQRCAS